MIISIINATGRERQEVQNKIRAVNRQLQEDFKPYWHMDVQLRREGWTGETPDPERPLNMRGDAVIYLWEDADTAQVLGYQVSPWTASQSSYQWYTVRPSCSG